MKGANPTSKETLRLTLIQSSILNKLLNNKKPHCYNKWPKCKENRTNVQELLVYPVYRSLALSDSAALKLAKCVVIASYVFSAT
jgi:hypothetical protein